MKINNAECPFLVSLFRWTNERAFRKFSQFEYYIFSLPIRTFTHASDRPIDLNSRHSAYIYVSHEFHSCTRSFLKLHALIPISTNEFYSNIRRIRRTAQRNNNEKLKSRYITFFVFSFVLIRSKCPYNYSIKVEVSTSICNSSSINGRRIKQATQRSTIWETNCYY